MISVDEALQLRTILGLNVTEIANESGVSYPTVVNIWARPTYNPTVDTLRKVCEAIERLSIDRMSKVEKILKKKEKCSCQNCK